MKCALVCIAKNEDNYIQEWVDYHLMLGFSDVYVWQNNWRTSVLKESERVHLREIDGTHKQIECYNMAIDELHKAYDWVAFFDIDEFLVLKPNCEFSYVDEFLSQQKYSQIPCICVNWRFFGDNYLHSIDSWNVLSRFTRCDDKLDETSKPIIHTSIMSNTAKFYYNPHCVTCYQFDPNLKFQLKCVGNNKFINDNCNDEPLELNHYRNKTYTEQFMRHFQKEDVLDGNYAYRNSLDKFNESFYTCNRNDIQNTYAKDFFESHACKLKEQL